MDFGNPFVIFGYAFIYNPMKKIILTTLCCLTAALTSAREKSPVTIIMQVSDPQMGFYADNRDMAYETRTLTKTVEAINRLRPDVVVFTGDYVHNAADESQWTEFLQIVAEINPRIKTLYLPGNHDVRLEEGSVDVEPYTKHLGTDRFCVRVNGILLTGINSDYLKDETRDPSKEENQFRWLARSLKKKRASRKIRRRRKRILFPKRRKNPLRPRLPPRTAAGTQRVLLTRRKNPSGRNCGRFRRRGSRKRSCPMKKKPPRQKRPRRKPPPINSRPKSGNPNRRRGKTR